MGELAKTSTIIGLVIAIVAFIGFCIGWHSYNSFNKPETVIQTEIRTITATTTKYIATTTSAKCDELEQELIYCWNYKPKCACEAEQIEIGRLTGELNSLNSEVDKLEQNLMEIEHTFEEQLKMCK